MKTNVTLTITKNTENSIENIVMSDVTKVAIGYRVIYVEYLENNELRIRAYGRREFNTVTIVNAENEVSTLVLRGLEFKRFDAQFDILTEITVENDNDNTETVEEEV